MKNKSIKRFLALTLAAIMVLGSTACSGGSGGFTDQDFDFPDLPTPSINDNPIDDNTDSDGLVQANVLSDPNLRYVMIYNPKVYDENARYDRSSLKLGTLGSQIDVSASRGDDLDEELPFTSVPQSDWLKDFPTDVQLEGDRAEPMGIDYRKGDTHDFYYSHNGSTSRRAKQTFTCTYSGQYCHVWTIDPTLSQSVIDDLGREFDQKIYKQVVGTFGKARFVGETGKVNLLLYDMHQPNLGGYFAYRDLLTEAELPAFGLTNSDCNTGHAVVHINAQFLQGSATHRAYVKSTMAHEFQHLVNFSAAFSTTNFTMMNTWLNEGFSGYIETVLYSNAKDVSGHYDSFNESDLIRAGQSLFNFETSMTYGNLDIGVYGSVYYFARYLEKTAGSNVFSDIMDYWRNSYSSTLTTSEALAQSVPSSLYNKINQSIDYSALNLTFANTNDEWMSKLALNFYLSTLSNADNISEFKHIDRYALLYDNIDGVDIEGGGRVVLALSGDSFEIPSGSDSGLIYVGLDENFQPITGFVYN